MAGQLHRIHAQKCTPRKNISICVKATKQACRSAEHHSLVFLVKPRFRFFIAAREPAIVSLIFSPAAAALDLADVPLPPPNLQTSQDTLTNLVGADFYPSRHRLLTQMGAY